MARSMVADNGSGNSVKSNVRTSSGMFLQKHQVLLFPLLVIFLLADGIFLSIKSLELPWLIKIRFLRLFIRLFSVDDPSLSKTEAILPQFDSFKIWPSLSFDWITRLEMLIPTVARVTQSLLLTFE